MLRYPHRHACDLFCKTSGLLGCVYLCVTVVVGIGVRTALLMESKYRVGRQGLGAWQLLGVL